MLTHTFHELGIQNNILVSVKYHHNSATLSRERLFRALARVISDLPSLSIIGVSQPSEKKAGHHRLWEARIPSIDLRGCVRFINGWSDDDHNMARILESEHNQKFDSQDKTKPWWRIVVVNGTTVAFIYHHSIGGYCPDCEHCSERLTLLRRWHVGLCIS